MSGCCVFAKLDLSNAYLQIMLDEGSRDITTITTPIGMFRFKRLVPGLKSSSSIYQKAIESVLNDIDKIIVFQDDILIGAFNVKELRAKVKKSH